MPGACNRFGSIPTSPILSKKEPSIPITVFNARNSCGRIRASIDTLRKLLRGSGFFHLK